MRTLVILVALLTVGATIVPAAAAAPPGWDEIGDCFKQTAQPSENPADLAFAVVGAAVCVLKS